MKKIIIFFFLLFFFLPFRVFADSNFKTDYNVTYNVMDNALTHVSFDITLANSTTQYYASSYSVQVGFKDIENVLARDSGGKIIPEITKNADGNSIKIDFNDRVVGLNSKLNFSISLDTKDIAQKSGNIWDINIPGLAQQSAYNSFNVKVIVPKYLENPSYIKPDSGKMVDGNLIFTKQELGESGISISFGKEQIYDFNLLYHLKNPNLFSIKTEIALPPSTNYQEVQISDINPKPLNVIEDADGNWLAQYILTSGKKMDISVSGKTKVMLNPVRERLSDKEFHAYLAEQPYWEVNKKEIKDLALKLKTPYAIYRYVADNLTYDFKRIQSDQLRIGAAGVVKSPSSAVCLEFTDLFIALARAAGIPAREINGFAYTQNSKDRPLSLVKDVLHAWPEYYDSENQTWIMVDPTWGNTTGGVDYFYKLDFDHFAFVIKGLSSTYPVPAGGYKISENDNSKDINVELGEKFASQAQILTISPNFAESYFPWFKPQGKILVRNTGQIISTVQEMTISTDILNPRFRKISIKEIPPYGFIEIPVIFDKPSLLTNKTDRLKIAVNGNVINKEIKISPFILNLWTILGGTVFVSIIIGISFAVYKTGRLSFFKPKQRDPLRR
jgi:transglutaminase-like putative cysteine protease